MQANTADVRDRMRISIATGPSYPVPAVNGGAVARVWDGLARALARRGHAVSVYARAFAGQPATETIDRVQYVRHGGFDQHRSAAVDVVRTFRYAASTVRRLPPADILVTNDFWLPVLARRAGTARAVIVNAQRYPKGQFRLYKNAHGVAAVSGTVKDAVTRQTPSLGERVAVLPNPIDTSRFQPYGSGTTRRPLHLLYVGRLHPEKGVDLLLRAFRRLCDDVRGCTLQVVGPHRPEEGGGGEAYRAALHRLAADLPVEFTGPVYDVEQLAALYRGAQVFCYPSLADRGEAFGVSALEAMACGAVPVVSDLACFRDFVVPGETGLVFDHRAEDAPQRLAATLERALGDTRLSTAMRNRGVAAARDFGFDEVAARYEAFFYSVLEQRNGVTRT